MHAAAGPPAAPRRARHRCRLPRPAPAPAARQRQRHARAAGPARPRGGLRRRSPVRARPAARRMRVTAVRPRRTALYRSDARGRGAANSWPPMSSCCWWSSRRCRRPTCLSSIATWPRPPAPASALLLNKCDLAADAGWSGLARCALAGYAAPVARRARGGPRAAAAGDLRAHGDAGRPVRRRQVVAAAGSWCRAARRAIGELMRDSEGRHTTTPRACTRCRAAARCSIRPGCATSRRPSSSSSRARWASRKSRALAAAVPLRRLPAPGEPGCAVRAAVDSGDDDAHGATRATGGCGGCTTTTWQRPPCGAAAG